RGRGSVLSYSVARRRREIGIRMALGARREDVVALVVGEGMRLGGSGIVVGLAGAWAATRLLSSLLYGVRPDDALIFAVSSALMTAVILAATAAPALRAARIDPTTALRSD
ncbi:MAG TPA: FtsX-like permease family protein, partial [Thermoanaerobaculia bacterium]|nr:FtsX-like permease family protein [Thermoanaerobaculia bacterium]